MAHLTPKLILFDYFYQIEESWRSFHWSSHYFLLKYKLCWIEHILWNGFASFILYFAHGKNTKMCWIEHFMKWFRIIYFVLCAWQHKFYFFKAFCLALKGTRILSHCMNLAKWFMKNVTHFGFKSSKMEGFFAFLWCATHLYALENH